MHPTPRRSAVAKPEAPARDSTGKPVDVNRRNPRTEQVDEVITPTSIKRKEQDAETLERRDETVERKL
ncbi:hypothetical protein HAQ06_19190 [Pseudomonas sp. C2L12B]|nr:hypothetical protein [Pseudomonas typographi]MBD1551346.1 hypothetical protein [Pseudomonas typographi]MBD1588772.1 hypothetical protein [Pseudomonas typographi]